MAAGWGVFVGVSRSADKQASKAEASSTGVLPSLVLTPLDLSGHCPPWLSVVVHDRPW